MLHVTKSRLDFISKMTINMALLQQSRYIMYLLYIIVLLFHDCIVPRSL